MQSFAVSATRCMLSSHTLQGQDFHHKIISRERSHAEPHSPISEQPTSSDKFVSECTVSLWSGGTQPLQRWRSLHQRLISPSCTVLTSVSSASVMQLRTFQCYPMQQKEVDLSQSVSCRVFHTSYCCLCAFSLIASLFARTHSAASEENSQPFSLYSHYWSFWWVMPHWVKCILYFSRIIEPFLSKYRVWAPIWLCVHGMLPGTLS